jgi:hypothetical protein
MPSTRRHALIVHARTGGYIGIVIDPLEERLRAALSDTPEGELESIERDHYAFTIFIYGQNADRLAELVIPVLLEFKPLKYDIVLRYGPPGAAERVYAAPSWWD